VTKKIVVTGIGATSPLGGTFTASWEALLAKESGIRTIDAEWTETYDLPIRFAGSVAQDPADVLSRQEVKRLDPSSQYALLAAREAWADAGSPEVVPERFLVDWATGIGGIWTLTDGMDTLREKGARRVLPMTIPMLMPNGPAAAISMSLGARAGARTVVSACASSTESIANAYDHLQKGDADIVIAGGSEASVHPLPLAAFASMHALSSRVDDPATASRPYDVTRDGFVLGEGGAALVLETEEHALARGARIYAELLGGAVTSDAFHITAPDPEGTGGARAVIGALEQAGVPRESVRHINAHATSTPVGDVAEIRALERVFGDHLKSIAISATKASTGHLLGGAGAIEAAFTVKALAAKTLPPTINTTQTDDSIDIDLVTEPRSIGDEPIVAISTSFGFGGHNAVVVFRSV
jgi:3-oxoacyl-[acyl-carrier-protein] synthase II